EPAKSEYGAVGVDLSAGDQKVRPGDDFFRYVNGAWLAAFKMPDDHSSYGSFTVVSERAEAQLKAILEASAKAPAGSSARKAADYYAAWLDVGAIDAKGLAPAAEDLAFIRGLKTGAELAAAFGRKDWRAASPIGLSVGVDAKRPERYAALIGQSGLGMPNRDYYLEEKFAEERAQYAAYVRRILELAGEPDAAAKAGAVVALEGRIAAVHWDPAKRRNRDLTYNVKSRAALLAFAPGLDWSAFLASAGLGARGEFILREDDAVAKIAALVGAVPLETWRSYLVFHLVNANAEVLPSAIDQAKFDFYEKTLRGAIAPRERWKRAVGAVNDALGEAVGAAYVAAHFPPANKEAMEALVGNLRAALKERLAASPWMSPQTRTQALAKLEGFTSKIGYPARWRDYGSLAVDRADAYGNARRAVAFEWRRVTARIDQPVDRDEWSMTPQTVNAYYNPPLNEIVFPAAILQPPFFNPQADAAVNYGAIGAVIGHEIGHGFDDQGRKSDGAGVLRDWWTKDDAAAFQRLADRLGAQYAAYEPIEGFPLNPKLTMGENIGDLGGLAMAYEAYKLSLGGKPAPVIDGFTGDQRFFMAW
ncbi:MAG: M13 family metallopeptidase, partial [Parvularculaceae bacterium]|nr:M13 family metallopeptidase [Parvularculaceae bacterium]